MSKAAVLVFPGTGRTFGSRLREAREDKGWTQSDLGEATGTDKTRVSRYENDRVLPTIESIEAFAHALEVNPAWLVGWTKWKM